MPLLIRQMHAVFFFFFYLTPTLFLILIGNQHIILQNIFSLYSPTNLTYNYWIITCILNGLILYRAKQTCLSLNWHGLQCETGTVIVLFTYLSSVEFFICLFFSENRVITQLVVFIYFFYIKKEKTKESVLLQSVYSIYSHSGN